MSLSDGATQPRGPDPFDPGLHPTLYRELLPRRVIAFAIDVVIVLVLMIPAAVAVGILGVITFGLGWLLYPVVFALIGLGYLALTLGGPESASVGMRIAGLEMRTLDGGRMYPVLAALHGLFFWVVTGFLTPLVLLVGLLNDRFRLLHDMLLGTVLLDARALRYREQDPRR